MRGKVLFVSHNHPELLVGGVELYLRDVYATLAGGDAFEPMLVARAGRPFTLTDAIHAATPIAPVTSDPNQYLIYTEFDDFDYFHGTLSATKAVLAGSFRDLLLALVPDIVHFQHTVYLGYDLVTIARRTLPDTPIVYSLHDYLPICNRDGVLVRTTAGELCEEESPRRCHECFPDINPQEFYIRKRFIRSHLALVDCFTVPSEYVKRRYVDWGLPEEKVIVHPYAVSSAPRAPEPPRAVRNRFGYFGQVNPYTGIDLLLRAMDRLGTDVDAHLWIHGANLEKQGPVWREQLGEQLAMERANVTFAGAYDRAAVGALMAEVDWVLVPSIWWETGPIVVLEAFRHGRPVICSDIGGMAEKVEDGVTGLHFRRGDEHHLAEVIRRAAQTPGLWDQLHAATPEHPGQSLEANVADLVAIYDRLLAERGPVRRAPTAPHTEQPTPH